MSPLRSTASPERDVPPLDEVDLDIIDALQIAPRVPLAALAECLSIPTSTVHRRLQRLVDERLLRVVGRHAWSLLTRSNPYELWIKVEPGRSRDVADALLPIPEVQLVFETTGEADVHAAVVPFHDSNVYELICERIPRIDGVVSVDSRLIIDSVRIAQQWRSHRLAPGIAAALEKHHLVVDQPLPGSLAALSEIEFEAMRALGANGRVTAAELSREFGVASSTANRAIQKILRSGAVLPRVEVEPALLGFPLQVLVSVDAEPGQFSHITQTLTAHPKIRMASVVTGPTPISVHGAFRSTDDFSAFVNGDLAQLQGVHGIRSAVVLRVARRYWMDRTGYRIEDQIEGLLTR